MLCSLSMIEVGTRYGSSTEFMRLIPSHET
jgi:hypothetical protein